MDVGLLAKELKPQRRFDWRGNEYVIGSFVLYPGRRGSSVWVTTGYVRRFVGRKVEIERVASNPSWWVSGKGKGKKVLVEAYNITVLC